MNQIENRLKETIKKNVELCFDHSMSLDEIVIEIPKDNSFGDYATNVAMRLAKPLRSNPKNIAETLAEKLREESEFIRTVEVAGPGFINFRLKTESLSEVIHRILNEKDGYGQTDSGKGQKINVEYVSANPTGDLHPGHARGAATGDSVSRILKKAGYDVTREYYVNDAGNQINNMGRSLQARYYQLFGKDVAVPEDGYHGKDLIDIAEKIKEEYNDQYLTEDLSESFRFFRQYGLQAELNKLKSDLALFRVEYDVWTSEQSIYDRGMVDKAIERLKEMNMTYEADGAVWLKTTQYGDDKDRVIIKSDGSKTYLMPDIAYHLDKYDRGFEHLVNFFGADHHGYINRLKAAVAALGYNRDALDIRIIQMARMIKDSEEFKMSKRTGKAIALRDLVEEAGVDAIRYYFASRAADTHMDLDLDMAKKQTNENPVYYAQYAHARVCSILRGHEEEIENRENYDLLTNSKEVDLMKYLNEFPMMIADAASALQPHRVCNYIQKLATLFHSFYVECKVLDEANPEMTKQRLALVAAVRITLKNALELIGVSAPERM